MPVIRLAFIPALTTLCFAQDAAAWRQLPPLPDRTGLASAVAGISGGALIVAGGANFPDKMPWEGGVKVWHDRAWVLDLPDGEWREAGSLPRPAAYGVALTANDRVLGIGGCDSQRHHRECLSLSWRDGRLQVDASAPPPLPIPLAYAAGALSGDTVIVAGGSTEPGEKSASDRVWAWNFPGREWRELPPIPGGPRILPAAAATADAFYVFGGAAIEIKDGKPARRYLRDAWRHTAADGWQRLADMPKPLVAAASPAPVVNGRILLIAGDDGSRAGFQPVEKHPGFPADILAYDIVANTWQVAGQTPAPRATLPVVPWDGQFILPSGEVRPGVRSPEIWSFAP